MKKDFWKRWLRVLGFSPLVSGISFVLMVACSLLFPLSGGFGLASLSYFFTGLPITYYILIFALSIWICKANMLQAVIVAATSPLSIVAHGWLIWLAGVNWGIW
ncbi:MAG: hypothetical protein FWH04_06640 [Oscillospiraceae bacterium]|nr:hypothetical protein [Oscillospiraceae bacterium]